MTEKNHEQREGGTNRKTEKKNKNKQKKINRQKKSDGEEERVTDRIVRWSESYTSGKT